MDTNKSVIYSQFFSKLINDNNEMDDTMTSFLYYLFPRELFIRALSLLDSGDMFIYVLENGNISSSSMNLVPTVCDSDESRSPSSSGNSNNEASNESNTIDSNSIVEELYDIDTELQNRLIVKTHEKDSPPIYVDLKTWFCSCDEFNSYFNLELQKNQSIPIQDTLIRNIDDIQEFSEDKFAQIDAHSLSKQKYVCHEKLMCPHLLAYSILLASSTKTLRYFTLVNQTVLLIRISNMDEWLKLHINIVS
ncbi:hypothetical protein Kpol_1055p32 [Vanderwaltozyma polyspora DSM 70294]|uniref:Suppressor of hydroxyurea sensitivity protein 2 n=1 Tax=Vanderwaltozyma polyspora (strain ATCC 22028 / DSM 70294 / BCRC 21397 / CBS 2163 / NBRC 10782 / NRRL Y-8283 / UCD 57-17) TaxID=436907 RepID=SHU2_VANPO|nr:uncharacterized protein Kpol_1055p32 [Vanderwaltozyma polyspora DSM 70294]A7TGA7.1 RecName: Full=Suppressor of hydroxyurea sensitivity protein 2 [Vanderwaltozyma polyspora DSM 70294]EDO18677.1 hypothetical protein Kpol_1055p32 [Vanderwaltozyma polyspora DSM 70294]